MSSAARKRKNPRADTTAQSVWYRIDDSSTPIGHKLAADISGYHYERYIGLDGKWRLTVNGQHTKPFSSLDQLRAYVAQHANGGR